MHCRTVQGGKHRICFFPCLRYNFWEVSACPTETQSAPALKPSKALLECCKRQ